MKINTLSVVVREVNYLRRGKTLKKKRGPKAPSEDYLNIAFYIN